MLKRLKQLILGGMALAALALGGSALAGAATGSSTPSTTTTTPETSAEDRHPDSRLPTPPARRTHGERREDRDRRQRGQAKAAALASVGGGTAGAVTGDFRNSGDYEVEVTKTDGSKVTVRLDSAFQRSSLTPVAREAPARLRPSGHAGPAPESGQAPTGTGPNRHSPVGTERRPPRCSFRSLRGPRNRGPGRPARAGARAAESGC